MPLLNDPPFRNDVFISYAHGEGLLRDWTVAFKKNLQLYLRDFVDGMEDVEIFIDDKLDRGGDLTPQLKKEVEASGLLIAVMSKRYLKSEWCQDELEWFQNRMVHHKDEVASVLVVKCQPTADVLWPAALRDDRGHKHLGFLFYDKAQAEVDGAAPPFGLGAEKPTGEYIPALNTLAISVRKKLLQIKAHQEKTQHDEKQSYRTKLQRMPNIFLPKPTGETSVWQDVRDNLEKIGCGVFSGEAVEGPKDLRAINSAKHSRQKELESDVDAACIIASGENTTNDLISAADDLKLINASIPRGLIGTEMSGNGPGQEDNPLLKLLNFETIKINGSDWISGIFSWLEMHYELDAQQL